MPHAFAQGLKPAPPFPGSGSGSRPGLPFSGLGNGSNVVVTPPPRKSLPAPDPDATAHAGGAMTEGLPNVGDIVLGFRIVEKIGQGGFGSVFLGEQVGLRDRKVALKFTSRPTTEPERMAALQHTNVVPVYSVHSQPPLQVLCMPYRGRHTLADAVKAITPNSLPATGAGLLSTTPKALEDTRRTRRRHTPVEGTPVPPVTAPTPQPIRDMLARLSFPESVVWLFARLADGLAHAHDRGILHLDLKPANVLITDDGMPMILDFGLAHDTRDVGYAVTGGTVRYMSPEQLDGYLRPVGFTPDRRMDLYALGVMFFELLTGRHPFDDGVSTGQPLPTLLAARRTVPPRVTAFNRRVSPAVAAIVAKLLQPDPVDRYQSANELLADLTRQQESRPLRHAGNPSVWERVRKFRRRHPVGTVAAAAVLFATAAVSATAVAVSRGRERAELAVRADAAALDTEARRLRLELPATDTSRRSNGLAEAGHLFARYNGPDHPAWTARLPEASQWAVRQTLGETAALAAHAEEQSADGRAGLARAEALERAAAWNARAAHCFAGRPVPPAVIEQGERLAAKANRPAPARPERVAEVTSFDRYLRGVVLLSDGRYAAAAAGLRELVEADPAHAAGQFSLGQAYQAQGQFADALERYQLAKALSPTDYRPALQRGILLLHDRRYADAVREFDTALARAPNTVAVFYHRGIARGGLRDWSGGIEDLTRAMAGGPPSLHKLLIRAQMHQNAGDVKAARADHDAADRLTPANEVDLVARGRRRVDTDPQAALDDFEQAAELNPRYLSAWQNQAHVYADKLRQSDKALAALDKALALAPEFAPARAGRAVVLARIGRRADAHTEAEKALAASRDPEVRYQVACVYALTAKTHPADKALAIQHFRLALQLGYAAFDVIDKDPDLKTLRDDTVFKWELYRAKQLGAR